MTKLIPDTIATRTLLVLIIGLSISHLLSVALYHTDRADALASTGGQHVAERIAIITQLIEDSAQIERPRIIDLANDPRLHVILSEEPAIDDQQDSGRQVDVLRRALSSHLAEAAKQSFRLHHVDQITSGGWEDYFNRNHQAEEAGEILLVSLPLNDGSWVNFAAPIMPPEPFWSMRFALSMAVMLAAVAVLSALVVRRMTEPLETFAAAATRLGKNVRAPALPERGPREVREAIGAFNEMQGRIRRFVEDRTEMLAAISHDLGTPITRLRLRAEFVEDDEQREKMLADLDDMEKMVFSALSFAREEAASEPHMMVDLRSLMQRVCDGITDTGHQVRLEVGENAVPFGCQPAALRRALTNLIDNAVKYGRQASVSLIENGTAILIRIDDEGPGIPEEFREDAFRPFRRLETSRNRETGGMGLGLAVARTIIRAHGGDITLLNREQGGLRAEVQLPGQ
jgi:signal transduction histidine kinase